MILKLTNILVFSVFLALLGATKPSTSGLKQDDFSPYVDEFIQNLHRFGLDSKIAKVRDIEMYFTDDLENNNIGVCYYLLNRVEISRKYWDKAPIHERDELINHELGHCVLGLAHAYPPSIMQASGILSKFYKENYSILTNWHFGCKKGDCINLAWDEERYK